MRNISNVYIDIRPLLAQNISGIGRYVEELLIALQRIVAAEKHPKVYYHFLVPKSPNLHRLDIFDENLFPHVKLPFDHTTMNYLTKYGFFPPIDIFLKKGLFIFPDYAGIPVVKSKMITFIYDLSFIIFPEFVHPGNRKYLINTVPKQIERSNSIITISESSKKDIVEHYGICPDDIYIIYPAVDQIKFSRSSNIEVEKVKNKHGISGEYLLFVGNIEPRKNISGIVNAYVKLNEGLLKENSLVIVGGSGWLNDEILQLIAKYQSDGYRIIFPTTFIGNDDLPALYSGASLFLFPSHYEGFGIPLLEAMASGTPILTSRCSSLPEVARDAAYYADPNTPETIAKGIAEVLMDEGLKKSLVEKGLKRVRQFTWEKSAREFHDLIIKSI